MKGWENIAQASRNPRVAKALGKEVRQRAELKLVPALKPPTSEGLANLWLQMKVAGLGMGGWVYELQFHPEREWRFDLAHAPLKIAIEYDGMRGKSGHVGRHRSWHGYQEDCEKLAEAAILGWTVLRFTHSMVMDGRAIDLILRAMEAAP